MSDYTPAIRCRECGHISEGDMRGHPSMHVHESLGGRCSGHNKPGERVHVEVKRKAGAR